jgi:hypothetical protein
MQIKVLVIPVGEAPRVETVTSASWRSWYPLIHPTTHTFQVLRLSPVFDLLCDEEGLYKPEVMKPNILVPVNGAVHQIVGAVIIARRRRSEYVSLTDDDIERLTRAVKLAGVFHVG